MSKRYTPKLEMPLTRKEEGIMLRLVDGQRRKEIIDSTGMAASTFEMHMYRIKAKLGAKTPEQAAVLFDRKKRS